MSRKEFKKTRLAKYFAVLFMSTSIVTISSVSAEEYVPFKSSEAPNWADSYEVNGKCYCYSNFDHGLGKVKINGVSIKEVCKSLGEGAKANRVYFNTVQCGHGPINSAFDEKICPGQPAFKGRKKDKYNAPGCSYKGAKWDLDGDVLSNPDNPEDFGDTGQDNIGNDQDIAGDVDLTDKEIKRLNKLNRRLLRLTAKLNNAFDNIDSLVSKIESGNASKRIVRKLEKNKSKVIGLENTIDEIKLEIVELESN